MPRHAETTATESTESSPLTSHARRVAARFFARRTGPGRPRSIETDAKLYAAHVRPASYRAELF